MTSILSQSPLCRFSYSVSSSPSSSSSPSLSLCSFKKNEENNRQRTSAMAHLRRVNRDCGGSCGRRALLFVAVSVLPFLKTRTRALEEPEVAIQSENQQEEQSLPSHGSPNQVMSLLNALGILSSGVLGALYALAQQDKKASEATIESMKAELKEKEASMVSVGKDYEMRLLGEQEERRKELRMAKEELQSLMNQLQSANHVIGDLGQEIQTEKRNMEEIKLQRDGMQNIIAKLVEDKDELELKLKEKLDAVESSQKKISLLSSEMKGKEASIQNLSSSLSGKDVELRDLSFCLQRTVEELENTKSKIEEMKGEVVKNQQELRHKNAALDDLNENIGSLIVERENNSRRIDSLQKEYSDLKASSGKKAALLEERELECQRIQDNLQCAMKDISRNSELVADLTRQTDDLREILDRELSSTMNLKQELQIKQDALVTARTEASNFAKRAENSNELCRELKTEISRVQSEFSEARESLQRSLDHSIQNEKLLAGELESMKELLKKSKDEQQALSHELASAAEDHDYLKTEYLVAQTRIEDTVRDLEQERAVVASLNKELQYLEKQRLNDGEVQKSLEKDLEEATKSLDEMNQNTLALSGELKKANSCISDLKHEKDALQRMVVEQKGIGQAARENLEDAHNLVMRLGKVRENMEKRSGKLEEDLLAAKGEILRLRSKVRSSRSTVNDEQQHLQSSEDEGNSGVNAKKGGRRRKNSAQ